MVMYVVIVSNYCVNKSVLKRMYNFLGDKIVYWLEKSW